ncbi:MAG: hypothetical protein KIS94_11425, partial [Chitinophagales bacterium]|nr:hypothetical protein [Chitinophagales bacterium]
MRKFYLFGLLLWSFALVKAQGTHEIYLNEGVLNGHPLLIPSKNILVSGSDLSTGIQAISDNRITLWDYNSGTVIKNITVDAYQYPEYKLSPSEKYLILKSEDSAKIFDLATLEFVLTIPSESSFMPMGGVLPFPHFFNSDSFLVFSHNNKYYTAQVSNSKSIAEMKSEVAFDLSNIGYRYKFYNHVFVLDKTYEIAYIDVLTGKMIERFDKKKYYYSGWEFEPITAGKHLLCHRYNEGKSQLCLFDKESNTFGTLHEINFFFSEYNIHELDKNKSWIAFSEASSKPGYPFAIVNIEHDTLLIKQFELNKGFSRMDADGANRRYNSHLLAITESKLGKEGSVLYTLNMDNGVRASIKETQTIDWVEIIDTNLIMYSGYNDKGKESRYDIKLLNTTSGKVSALPAGSSPILKPVGTGKYNALTKENESYKLAMIKNGTVAESKPFASGIKKLHIALKGKINDELIFTVEDQSDNSLYSLFKLPDFNAVKYNNLIIIHANEGKVESNRYPETIVKKALESEYNFICKRNDSLNWMGGYDIDSVSLIYINTAKILYKSTYKNFTNSFPYPSPCEMDWVYALDTTQTAFIYKTYYEFGKFSIINGVIKKEYSIPIKYATVQIGFCNNAQHMYLIGNTECIVYETGTGKPMFNYKLDYLGMQLTFTQSSKFIVSNSSKKQITVLDFKNPLVKHVFEWENKKWIGNSMAVESSGNIFYTIERTGKLKVYSLKNAKLLNEINVGGNRDVPALLLSDSVLLYFHTSGKPAVWNFYTNSMELYSSVAPHARVTSMYYWNETKQLVTTGFNSISVWNTDSKELLYQVLVGDTADFIVVDKDGYYSGAKTMFPKIRVRQGSSVIHPGQIDILYNRPDKITQTVSHAFGKVDTALVNSYYRAWQKRVSKLKVDTTLLNLTQPPPSSDILHKEDYAKASSYATDLLHLTFRGVDTTNILSNYNIWVNDVPV